MGALKRTLTHGCAALLAVGFALTACGGSQGPSTTTASAPERASSVDLSGVCPETVVIQTDWNPEAEHGFVYNLIGPGYSVDTERFAVRGDLVSGGMPTGVTVELRAGGPAVAYASVTARLYADPAIMMGFVGTDAAIKYSGDKPTIAVLAPLAKNPQIIMWDPASHPGVTTIAGLKKDGVKVRYFKGVTFVDYLVQSGVLAASQTDGTYDGTPKAWLASGGTDAQQGFGTSDPYFYENDLQGWRKPVAYQYVHDTGWQPYAQSLALTPTGVETHRACLEKLVPVVQRSLAEFVVSPQRANEIIVDAARRYDNGWVYTIDQAAASVDKQRADGIVANSPDGTLGSFDRARVTAFVATAVPFLQAAGAVVRQGLTADDLATNEFLDASISLG